MKRRPYSYVLLAAAFESIAAFAQATPDPILQACSEVTEKISKVNDELNKEIKAKPTDSKQIPEWKEKIQKLKKEREREIAELSPIEQQIKSAEGNLDGETTQADSQHAAAQKKADVTPKLLQSAVSAVSAGDQEKAKSKAWECSDNAASAAQDFGNASNTDLNAAKGFRKLTDIALRCAQKKNQVHPIPEGGEEHGIKKDDYESKYDAFLPLSTETRGKGQTAEANGTKWKGEEKRSNEDAKRCQDVGENTLDGMVDKQKPMTEQQRQKQPASQPMKAMEGQMDNTPPKPEGETNSPKSSAGDQVSNEASKDSGAPAEQPKEAQYLVGSVEKSEYITGGREDSPPSPNSEAKSSEPSKVTDGNPFVVSADDSASPEVSAPSNTAPAESALPQSGSSGSSSSTPPPSNAPETPPESPYMTFAKGVAMQAMTDTSNAAKSAWKKAGDYFNLFAAAVQNANDSEHLSPQQVKTIQDAGKKVGLTPENIPKTISFSLGAQGQTGFGHYAGVSAKLSGNLPLYYIPGDPNYNGMGSLSYNYSNQLIDSVGVQTTPTYFSGGFNANVGTYSAPNGVVLANTNGTSQTGQLGNFTYSRETAGNFTGNELGVSTDSGVNFSNPYTTSGNSFWNFHAFHLIGPTVW